MKKLKIVKVIDVQGWSYDFIGKEQKIYSRHDIVINKYDNIDYENTDIIYLHSPNINNYIANHVPIIARDKGIKVIGGYGGDPRFWHESVARKYIHSDLIVTISRETYRFAKEVSPDKPVIFLPESVDSNFFTQSPLNSDTFNVGWAGSSFPIKRPEILDKLKHPVRKMSQWGTQYFKKERTLDSMLYFYQSLNVFILASITECMPRVILEAMACGLPIISTDVGNLSLLLDKEWIVPVYPEEKVIEEINYRLDLLKNNFELQKEVGERNRQYIEKNFSWKVTQPMWDDVFNDLYNNNQNEILSKNEKYLQQFKGFININFSIDKKKPKIAYFLPGTGISGGIAVMLQQANRLHENGYNVFLITMTHSDNISWYPNNVPIYSLTTENKEIFKDIEILILSGWQSVTNLSEKLLDAKRKIYFVQSDERRFFDDIELKKTIHKTYEIGFEYMTEALWIQRWLKEEFGHNSYYVPNGIDTEQFYKTEPIVAKTRPRVLLEGAIDIGFKGVKKAYEAVKDLNCEIWFASNSGRPKADWRCDRFFEKVSFDFMKNIYSSCDILVKMSSIEGFFGPPLEAMACGCAVVVGKCTGYDEYIKDGENALVVDNDDIYAAKKAVKSLIENNLLREKLILNGYRTVSEWSWSRTIESLKEVIKGDLKKSQYTTDFPEKYDFTKERIITSTVGTSKKKCDIIIVTHNALQYIQRCIESIKKYTKISYNIIIVDNKSDYETKSYLSTLDCKVILNDKNYGFGYANNQGILASCSEYICFLNSDTIVTEDWLENLINAFYNGAKSGFVGPVTNFVSLDYQRVDIGYVHDPANNDDSKIHERAKIISQQQKISEVGRLIGFCMLTRRDVLSEIGMWDERYPIGCFEDDDLSLRAIERGYKLYCASGVFIYHFGGESFKEKFKTKTHNETLKTNEKIFVSKWYDTKRVNQIYSGKKRLKIIYLAASDGASGGVKIIFEHANRLLARGHDVTIYCAKREATARWFDIHAPIIYSDLTNLPACDIAVGTYFTTLNFLKRSTASVKIHLCQGYEALLYEEASIVKSIKNNYSLIRTKIVVSKWLQEIVKNDFDLDSTLIENGIDQYIFNFSIHKRNEIPKILIVGNDDLEFKGTSVAVEGVKKFAKENKVEIVRLASSPQKTDLKCEYYDMTKMSQREIAEIYSSCDVMVSTPFKVEGYSLPPLEAMASGTPVITSDSGGVNTYAVNSHNAIIVQQKNSDAVQHGLKLLLSNNDMYRKLAENGLETAKNHYWYKQIDKLEDAFYKFYNESMKLKEENLSVCIIAKNEEKNLERCLGSIREVASEIILVDTGSIDDTVNIAKRYGATIYHYEWNNDFSSARNFSLEKATQPWVLIIDADETISQKDIPKLRNLLKSQNTAYEFVTRNYVDDYNVQGIVTEKDEYKEGTTYVGWCESSKIRLFPLNENIKFDGKVHELVENSVRKSGMKLIRASFPIHHFGYLDKEKQKSKKSEYLKLGIEKSKNNDVKAIVELACQYMSLNNYDEALVLWRRALEQDENNHEFIAKLGTTYNLLNDYNQAEKYFLKSLSIKKSDYAYQHLGICYAKRENYEKAYDAFKNVVNNGDLQVKSYFAHCCNILKKFDESIIVLEKCLAIDRSRTISWGLLEIAYHEKGVEMAKTGKLKQALSMFHSVLRINPEFKTAQKNAIEISRLLNRQKVV